LDLSVGLGVLEVVVEVPRYFFELGFGCFVRRQTCCWFVELARTLVSCCEQMLGVVDLDAACAALVFLILMVGEQVGFVACSVCVG
jgi:hypothetical protein